MARRRREVIDALEIIIAVLSALIEVLNHQEASEDRLLEKGGMEND